MLGGLAKAILDLTAFCCSSCGWRGSWRAAEWPERRMGRLWGVCRLKGVAQGDTGGWT